MRAIARIRASLLPVGLACFFALLVLAPATDAQGCPRPRVGTLGLATFGSGGLPQVELAGAPAEGLPFHLQVHGRPHTFGWMLYAFEASPLPLPRYGAVFHAQPVVAQQAFPTDACGSSPPLARVPLVSSALCGRYFVAQAFLLDPAAQGGLAFTRATEVVFGGPPGGALFDTPLPAFAPDRPLEVAIGDVDGDQVADLVVAVEAGPSPSPGGVAVLDGNGDGTFAPAEILPATSQWTGNVGIGDLNGDRIADIVATTSFGSGGGEAAVLIGRGGGAFEPPVLYYAGQGPTDFELVDLDGDDDLDLAVANIFATSSFPTGAVSLLFNQGDGTFDDLISYGAKSVRSTIATPDLNGDKIPDVVVGVSTSLQPNRKAEVAVRLGSGGGSLGPLATYSASTLSGVEASDVALADFDGDGLLDVAVACTGAFSGPFNLSILLGGGDGTFGPPIEHSPNRFPKAIRAADVDRDQVVDLVVASSMTPDVQVFFGVGDGTLTAGPRVVLRRDASRLAVGDVDGDLLPDLIHTDAFEAQVTVRLNQLLR